MTAGGLSVLSVITLSAVTIGFVAGPSRVLAAQAPAAATSGIGQSATAPGKSVTTPDYIIGPGDGLSIFVYRFPEQSGTYTVRPDGKLTIPLVEDMVAVGKTSTQLARDIEAALGEYLKSPKVNVIVASATNAVGQVRVLGAVKVPKSVPFREGMTILDVIEAAGGLSDSASSGNATITRVNEQGRETKIKVRLKKLLVKGDKSENIPVRAGDYVVVPQSWF